MADIFISFIHEEEPIAKAIQDYLEALVPEATAFFSADQWQVFAGEDWFKKICDSLMASKVVILLLSPESVVRPWVNFEAGAAWLNGKHVIPCCFKGLQKVSLPKPYSSLQAIDLHSPSDHCYLLHSVCHYLGKLSPMTPPPKPSLGPDTFAKDREPYDRLRNIMQAVQEGKSPMVAYLSFFPKPS